MLKTHVFGNSPLVASTPQNQHMKLFLLELFSLDHGGEFGRVGPLASVSFSCGQLHTKDAGQQTGWQEKGYNILLPAHCDQAQETIDHLLVSCVFARQMWFFILQKFGLQMLAPNLEDESFDDWWISASGRVSGQVLNELNSIIILGTWNLWNHRNRCVFDGASPSISNILSTTFEDLQQWSLAGARGVSYLLALVPRDS
jgi:hypothetical protein